MPAPQAIGSALRAAIGGVGEMLTGSSERRWVDAAALRFDNIGSDESKQVAELIRANPRGANQYVNRFFGGWEKLETGLRERQHRTRAELAVAEFQGMAPEERGAMSEDEAFLQVADEAARGDMSLEMAQRIATTAGAPSSFNRALALGPTPESAAEAVSHGMKTGDWEGEQGAISKLKSEPDRRVTSAQGGNVMLETVTDAEGKTTTKRTVVEGSDLDKLEKDRPGGRWLDRIILHQRLERRDIHPGSQEYENAFREHKLEMLSSSDLLEAEIALRGTKYDMTPTQLERLLAAGEGGGGGGGSDLPPR
jgi:hypothetical protein